MAPIPTTRPSGTGPSGGCGLRAPGYGLQPLEGMGNSIPTGPELNYFTEKLEEPIPTPLGCLCEYPYT